MHAFEEQQFGDRRDGDERCGVREAFGVVGGAEDGYGVVWAAEGFHAFIGLLAVVEGGCHAVEAQVGVCYEFRGRPLACFDGVVGFDVAIDWGKYEREAQRGGVLEGKYLREL